MLITVEKNAINTYLVYLLAKIIDFEGEMDSHCTISSVSKNQEFFTESRMHCVESFHFRRFSGPYFPKTGLNTKIYKVNSTISLVESILTRICNEKMPICE